MVLFFLVGLFLLGTAVTVLARSFSAQRTRAVEVMGQIRTYGYAAVPPTAEAGGRPARATLDGIASVIGDALGERLGSVREAALRKQLVAAGLYKTPPRRFLGYQLLSTVALPLFMAWLSAAAGTSTLILGLSLVFGTFAGWSLPRMIVRRRAARRLGQIDYDLPELIDLLVVSVEAGLGFNGSMRMAVDRLAGPLGEELRLTLQEQNMGLTSNEALKNFLERCDTPSVRSFVRSVTQGETLGVSIGQIMRNLAGEMRKRRRQTAEERAQKAPVKILFPLVFLIFPAIFVVILGPAMFTLLETLG
jgi:tight adherence protein C